MIVLLLAFGIKHVNVALLNSQYVSYQDRERVVFTSNGNSGGVVLKTRDEDNNCKVAVKVH